MSTNDPDRIQPESSASLNEWAQKLAVTPQQIREAVAAVGDRGADVELHLKGTRSTTNEERVDKAPGNEKSGP